jgi:hypothetical protein
VRNSIGSLRYDMYGRKRKTKALNTPRRPKVDFKPMVQEKSLAQIRADEHRAKYPSAEMSSTYTPNKDQSWKQEASKNFTIAPAYNKGAYQVIPRKDVEHIGR